MPPYFSERRSAEISTFEYLKTQLEANWSNISVIKSFTQAYDKGINPPIVCVRRKIPRRLVEKLAALHS